MTSTDDRTLQFAAEWRHVLDEFGTLSRTLALHGWAVPLSLTMSELLKLSQQFSSVGPDEWFLNYYTADDGLQFRALAQRLSDDSSLSPWQGLLHQCLFAYERSHFAITVPTLLLVLEGRIARSAGNQTRVPALVKQHLIRHQGKWPDSLTAAVWRSMVAFVEQLYKASDFAAGRPAVLNRHWVLHGRDHKSWDQKDSLRLFQALATTCSVMAHGSDATI